MKAAFQGDADKITGKYLTPELVPLFARGMLNIARHICPDYDGGLWYGMDMPEANCFYCCMAPDGKMLRVLNHGAYSEASVTKDAFGIIVTMYVLSNLSFYLHDKEMIEESRRCADAYHALRDAIYDDLAPHPEHAAIWAMLD